MPAPKRLGLAVGPGLLAAVLGLVSASEGFRTHAYRDPVGIPTICSGVTAGVQMGDVRTPAECSALVAGEIAKAVQIVRRCIVVPLNDNQTAAFADAAYNIGPSVVCGSTLQRKANSGDLTDACNELLKWVYAGGQKLKGLVIRRQRERELCLRPV